MLLVSRPPEAVDAILPAPEERIARSIHAYPQSPDDARFRFSRSLLGRDESPEPRFEAQRRAFSAGFHFRLTRYE